MANNTEKTDKCPLCDGKKYITATTGFYVHCINCSGTGTRPADQLWQYWVQKNSCPASYNPNKQRWGASWPPCPCKGKGRKESISTTPTDGATGNTAQTLSGLAERMKLTANRPSQATNSTEAAKSAPKKARTEPVTVKDVVGDRVATLSESERKQLEGLIKLHPKRGPHFFQYKLERERAHREKLNEKRRALRKLESEVRKAAKLPGSEISERTEDQVLNQVPPLSCAAMANEVFPKMEIQAQVPPLSYAAIVSKTIEECKTLECTVPLVQISAMDVDADGDVVMNDAPTPMATPTTTANSETTATTTKSADEPADKPSRKSKVPEKPEKSKKDKSKSKSKSKSKKPEEPTKKTETTPPLANDKKEEDKLLKDFEKAMLLGK